MAPLILPEVLLYHWFPVAALEFKTELVCVIEGVVGNGCTTTLIVLDVAGLLVTQPFEEVT